MPSCFYTDHFAPTLSLSSRTAPCSRSYYPIITHPIDLSFLEPNLESGANIDCCKLYRENKGEYERIVRQSVREQLGL